MQTISTNRITQTEHGQYHAVDISPSPDPDYYAPEDGTITSWGDSGTCGLRLVLDGPTGRHGFCHNERAYVKVGDKVKRGQKLGRMGYTGLTDPDNVPAGTHVHWVILKNGVYVYPPSLVNQSFIKLGEEEMVTRRGVKDLYRHFLGKDPTAEEYAKYTDKVKYDVLRASLADSSVYEKRLASAKAGTLNTVAHLPELLRVNYVAPATGYVKVNEELFRKV